MEIIKQLERDGLFGETAIIKRGEEYFLAQFDPFTGELYSTHPLSEDEVKKLLSNKEE